MEWKRGPTIGRGSTATVSLATASTGEQFAVKSTHLSSSTLLQKEQHLISQLSSPYVVKCLGSDITYNTNSTMYNLFLEYVPGGTLSDLIKNHGGSVKQNVIQFYTHQLLQGLNYLHVQGVVHCDIKGQNLLISDDGLIIADFGCAKLVEATSGFAGTPSYMAPEVARGEEQSFPADIWAVGCTVIEMATGSNPWSEMKDPASALFRIGYSNEVPEFPSWFSGDAKDFLTKCLMKDTKKRWTAAQLLQHPFMISVGKIGELTKKSPTSVMDQGFWDAVEVSDSSTNLTDIDSSSDSAGGRIRGLIGDCAQPNLKFSDWTDQEEEWVTVRSYKVEACWEIVEQNCDRNEDYEELIEAESFLFSTIDDDEEIGTSIAIEDLFNCYRDEISVVDEQGIVFHSEKEEDIRALKSILIELFISLDQTFVTFKHLFFAVKLFHCSKHYGESYLKTVVSSDI